MQCAIGEVTETEIIRTCRDTGRPMSRRNNNFNAVKGTSIPRTRRTKHFATIPVLRSDDEYIWNKPGNLCKQMFMAYCAEVSTLSE